SCRRRASGTKAMPPSTQGERPREGHPRLTVGIPTNTLPYTKDVGFEIVSKAPGRGAMRTNTISRAIGVALTTALIAGAAASVGVAQEAPKSIKVGYVISLSGPQSAGAMLTTVPNYRLWVDEINKAGGLNLKKYGKKIPIEATEIDDRSNNEDMVRLVERLMTVDKVDLVLSPWGTGPNLQAAPVFAKYGYPHLVGTGNSDKIPELVGRFPTTFS